MRPSEFSPLPVGPIENDPETESDTEHTIPVTNKNTEESMEQFAELHCINHTTGCRTMLFDAIIIPVEEEIPALNSGDVEIDCKYVQQINAARHERNSALQVAQIYRDLAETIQKEKRKVQDDLESRVDAVQKFWRNQVVEGQSRAGQILRAALFKK